MVLAIVFGFTINSIAQTQGESCANPITITLPVDAPYIDLSQTTAGMLNNYSNGCVYSGYSSGEDIIYELTVTSDIVTNFTIDPKTTDMTSIYLTDMCPDLPAATCIAYSASDAGNTDPHGFSDITLAAGTYYLMISNWIGSGFNLSISDFDLTIEAIACPAPSDITSAFLTQNSVQLSWNGYTASSWDLEVGTRDFSPTGTPTHDDVTNNYVLTGLTANTEYDVWVRSDCGSETITWEGPYQFKTLLSSYANPTPCEVGLAFDNTTPLFVPIEISTSATQLGTDFN